MHHPILMGAALLLILSCGTKNHDPQQTAETTASARDTASASSPYFPVYDFIRNEIEYVDSLPVGIMKYTTTGKKKDSGYIKLDEFHQLAEEFLTGDLRDSVFKQKFTETSFADRSNNSATFFYRSTDDNTLIKRVDVVTVKGDVYDEVKSIYIEKRDANNDSSDTKKLYWLPKRNFQIISVAPNGNTPSNKLIKVVWDNSEQ